MSYRRTRRGERGHVTELYAREAGRTRTGYHRVGDMAPVPSGSPMVARTFATAVSPVATRKLTTVAPTATTASIVPTRPGYVWVPPTATTPGYWKRAPAASRPVVSVEETRPTTDASKRWCAERGWVGGLEQRVCMNHYLRGGRDEDAIRAKLRELAAQAYCRAKGITGGVQQRICMRQWEKDHPGAGTGRGAAVRIPAAVIGGAIQLPGQVAPNTPGAPGAGSGTTGGSAGDGWLGVPGGGHPSREPTPGGPGWTSADLPEWGGGASLPGEMAPTDVAVMRPRRPGLPVAYIAAGVGGVALLYILLKRKK